MKRTSLMKMATAAVLASGLSPAMAEQPRGVDLTAGNYFDVHQPYLGVGYRMPVAPRWSIEPNAEYVFVDVGHMYTFNVDGRYLLNPSARSPMYVGGGLGMIRRNGVPGNNNHQALNLTWGVDFNTYPGSVTPFINTKAVLSGNSDFAVSFGVRFGGSGSARETAVVDNSMKARRASGSDG